jgi:hypothetical protein
LRLFLAVRFATTAATNMQAVAVGWYIYALTGSALDLGFIGLMQFLPFAGLALPAGHLIDRVSRRRIVCGALTVGASCNIVLAILAFTGTGSAGSIFVLVACLGAARAFEQPAMQSWPVQLVPAEIFPRAAAWNSLASQAAVVTGPSIGGLLYLLGPAVPFIVAATMIGIGAGGVLLLPATRIAAASEPLSWSGFTDGIRFIWRNEIVRGAITLDLFAVLFGGAVALLPIFARDILAVGPAGLGLLRSAPALGALVTGFVLTRRPPQRHVGQRMLIAVGVYGVATIVFGLSRSPLLSVLALMTVGAADMLSVVIRSTMVQVAAPDAIRGRVTAVNSLFTGTSNQLGQFESGVTAAWFGPVGSVLFGGTATLLLVGLWVQRFPALRSMDRLAARSA